MSNQDVITKLIKDISGQSNTLVIPRVYISMTGDVKAALFLSQCVYWSDKTKRDDGYFYKSSAEWEEELGLSRREIEGARKKVAAFLSTKIVKANGAPTLHYKANLLAIAKWIETFYTKQPDGIAQNVEMELDKMCNSEFHKMSNSLTDTTHSITHRIKSPKSPAKSAALFSIAQTLAEVCDMDFDKNRGRLFREATYYTVDDIEQIKERYGPGGWWYKNDWRGEHGGTPTLSQIREKWKPAKPEVPANQEEGLSYIIEGGRKVIYRGSVRIGEELIDEANQ